MSDVFNLGVVPTAGYGTSSANPPIQSTRPPGASDTGYPIGQTWVDTDSGAAYTLVIVQNGTATWNIQGGGGAGGILSVTGDAGGAQVADGGGNFDILGTAGQIETTGTLNTLTLSIPDPFIAPGDVEITGKLTVLDGATIDSGTNPIEIATDANPATVTIGPTAALAQITVAPGNLNQVNVASGAGTQIVNIASGNNTGTTTITVANGTNTGGADVRILSGSGSSGTASQLYVGNNPTIDTASFLNASPLAARTTTFVASAGAEDETVSIGTFFTSAGTQQLIIMGGSPSGGTQVLSLGDQTGNPCAITIGAGTGTANTISIGGDGANIVGIADTQTAGSVSVGAGMTTGTINIGGTGAQTGTISIGVGNGAQAINLGSGGAAKTVSLGSTVGASATAIRAGSGNMLIDGAAATTYSVGPSATSGTFNFGGTGANTGTMTIAGGTGAQTVNIANSTGGKTVAIASGAGVNTVTLGSTNSTSKTNINGGSAGIEFTSGTTAGLFNINTATDSQASPSATSILNTRAGAATFTGFTTASAGTQDFTITNSLVTTSSNILCTVCNEGANDAQMTITRITRAAGSFVVKTKNNGAAALNGDVIVTFWVLDN